MRYLHSMIRVADLDAALDFFVNKLGMVETRRMENEKGRFTLDLSRRAGRCRAGVGKRRAGGWS